MRFLFLFITLLLLLPNAHAEYSVLAELPSDQELVKYKLPFSTLNERQKWRVKIHGLRLAPLDPTVWASLKRERTENRRLVPIKRFFLRASEAPNFNLKSITFRFRFKAADPKYMEKMPHQKDPVFDIGFGGVFTELDPVKEPIQDSSYALRLSAFPRISSGIVSRRKEAIKYLRNSRQLEVGKWYDVKLKFENDQLHAFLENQLYT